MVFKVCLVNWKTRFELIKTRKGTIHILGNIYFDNNKNMRVVALCKVDFHRKQHFFLRSPKIVKIEDICEVCMLDAWLINEEEKNAETWNER